MSAPATVNKSYEVNDPVKDYCLQHSSPPHPVQKKLLEETLKIPHVRSSTIYL